MANDPGVNAFLDAWNALPPGYVPQYEFAYSENDGGLYAFPASERSKVPYLVRQGQSFWNMPSEDPDPVTSQALATGQVPGAERIDAAGRYGSVAIDPKYSQDLGVWQRNIQAGNANDDSFKGLIANVFGNSFTLPALFAASAMAANAFPGISTPGSAASNADVLSGGGGSGTLTSGVGNDLTLGAEVGSSGTGSAVPLNEFDLLSPLGTSTFVADGTAGAAPGLLATLKAAAPYVGLATTVAGGLAGGLGGGGTSTSGPSVEGGSAANAEEILRQLRQLGVEGIPGRQALQGEALSTARQAANASPQLLLSNLRGQITQLRKGLQGQFAQASKSLGPAGSKLAEGAQGTALAQAGEKLSEMLAQAGSAGQSGLLSYLQNLKPSLVTSVPSPVTNVTEGESNFAGLAGLFKGGADLKSAYDQNNLAAFGLSPNTSSQAEANAAIQGFRDAGYTVGI